MTARTHDLAAITALGVVVLLHPFGTISPSTAIIAILANQIGGITPDIDQPTAPFWRNLPITRLFGKFFDNLMGGHRFLTHSVLGLALFGFLSKMLLSFVHPLMPHTNIGYIWWAFMIGMTSHLVMDSFTKEGVPWLLPIPIKFGFPPLKALRVTTGKFAENWLVLPALAVVDIWLFTSHYPQILLLLHQRII
ncbi:MAG: Membrane protein containing transrane [Candidatus Saccharibacteria bacterium]|nr:Membrane protein containing transrane [Candidatus Saccharibacteria bacterium]